MRREKDKLGSLHVDEHLRLKSQQNVFATGDTAYAATDDEGNHAAMSCQHAMILRRTSGHHVAADLFGTLLRKYAQKMYSMCLGLGLGPAGAVLASGWERNVLLTGDPAKRVKKLLKGTLI